MNGSNGGNGNVTNFLTTTQKERLALTDRMIETLEELLAKARDGQLIACSYAYVENDGNIGNGYSGISDGRLVLSTTMLEHRIKGDYHNVMMEPRRR